MAGGYAPLGDLYKMEVYSLARQYNKRIGKDAVTESTLTKPPSAELAPDQKDEDSLPPYPVLDEMLRLHIEEGLDATEITAKGHDGAVVREVLTRLSKNEHKRWQMAPELLESQSVYLVRDGGNLWLHVMIGVNELQSNHRLTLHMPNHTSQGQRLGSSPMK